MSDQLISAVYNVAATDRFGSGLVDGCNAAGNPVSQFVSNEDQHIFATTTNPRESVITKVVLSKKWGFSLETTSRTLKVTTESEIRKIIQPLEHRFKSFQKHLNYPTIAARYFLDTMFAETRSIRGFSMGQVFTDG